MTIQDNDVLRATVIHDNAVSGEQINVYQYQLTTPAPVPDSEGLGDVLTILEIVYNIVANMINLGNILREVGVINITQGVILGSGGLDTYTGGTAAGDQVPQGAAAFVYFKTVRTRVILSKYLPSASEGTLGFDGKLIASALANLASFGASLITPNIIAGKTYTYGHDSPKPPAAFVVPISVVARDVLAYQRRRKPGRGS